MITVFFSNVVAYAFLRAKHYKFVVEFILSCKLVSRRCSLDAHINNLYRGGAKVSVLCTGLKICRCDGM